MELSLKNIQWGEFEIGKIFKVSTGNLLPKSVLRKGDFPRITATDNNNGVYDYYQKLQHKNYREITNFISVSFLGSVFYHSYTASLDMKIHAVQIINKELNKYLAEFLVLCLKRTVSIFSYGDQLSSSDLPKKKILIPINSKGEPDYAFMEQFMRQKEQEKIDQFQNFIAKRIEQVKDFKTTKPLNQIKWGEFEIGKLFKLYSGKSKGLNHLQKSNFGVNYLGATNFNNGVLSYVNPNGNEKMLQKGNCIAFIRNGEGSMGYSIYKAEKFIATSDITVGYSENLNREVGLFMTTIADKIRGKYNFGYKRSETRLKKEKLQLPTDKNGQPDYDYMENYIKKIEYEKLQAYSTYIRKK